MVSKLRLLRLQTIQFCFLSTSFVLNHHKPKTMYQGAPLCLSRHEMYSCSVFTSLMQRQVEGTALIQDQGHVMVYYRPRSEGDNVLGSVRPSVRL